MPSRLWYTAFRLCVRPAWDSTTFSSIGPLPSSPSAECRSSLFGAFAGTTGLSDFPTACMKGLWLIAFPFRPSASHAAGAAGTSWFPCKKFPGMR